MPCGFSCGRGALRQNPAPDPHGTRPRGARDGYVVMKQVMGKLAALAAGVVVSGTALAQQVGTTVRVATDKGPIDLQLYDQAAPVTVANFLNYVRRGAFDGTFFHRLATGFVLQGGGYVFNDNAAPRVSHIATDSPIVLEASTSRSNLRGTVAMARSNAANSATSEWYINLVDNKFLDPSSPGTGYAVFGRVSAPSMGVVNAIEALNWVNASGCFAALGASAGAMDTLLLAKPLSTMTCEAIRSDNLLFKRSVKILPAPATLSDTDRVLNYLEAQYPQYIAPSSPVTQTGSGYVYRYYEGTKSYVGSKDGWVHYLVPSLSPDVKPLAPLADLLQQAAAAGY